MNAMERDLEKRIEELEAVVVRLLGMQEDVGNLEKRVKTLEDCPPTMTDFGA